MNGSNGRPYRFGSAARDFAAGHIMREGGTPEEIRENFTDTELDRIAYEARDEFDWNSISDMSDGIRDWYSDTYPDDESGTLINPHATFAQAVESFHDGGGGLYDLLGVGDSVIRERVFDELSSRIGCGYDDIYDAWLNGTDLDPRLVSGPISTTGQQFDIKDVEMKATAAWANGPRVLDAELPDCRVLGHVMPSENGWLWRLKEDEQWHRPTPVEGAIARFIDQEGREAAILSLLNAIETRYFTSDNGHGHDMGETLTGTEGMDLDGMADVHGPTR